MYKRQAKYPRVNIDGAAATREPPSASSWKKSGDARGAQRVRGIDSREGRVNRAGGVSAATADTMRSRKSPARRPRADADMSTASPAVTRARARGGETSSACLGLDDTQHVFTRTENIVGYRLTDTVSAAGVDRRLQSILAPRTRVTHRSH